MNWRSVFENNNFDFSKLSGSASEFLEECFLGAPVRDVQNGSGSLSGSFFSLKNKCTCYVESSLERSFCVRLELDRSVCAYIPQPVVLRVKLNRGQHGKMQNYVPDYLVAYTDGSIQVVECKPPENLAKLLNDDPNNWVRSNGEIQFRPGAEALESRGVKLRVYTGIQSRVASANTDILYAFLLWRDENIISQKEVNNYIYLIEQMFLGVSRCSALELMRVIGARDLVPVFELYLRGIIFIDIDTYPLSEETYIEIEVSSVGQEIGPFSTPINLSQSIEERMNAKRIAVGFAEKELDKAEAKYIKYKRGQVSHATSYRYSKRIKDGAKNGLSPIESLVECSDRKGNRKNKREIETLKFARKVLDEIYPSPESPSIKSCYRIYIDLARDRAEDVPPVCYQTFRRLAHKIKKEDLAWAVGGRRLKNSVASSVPSRIQRLIPLLPFVEASIDHWTMDTSVIIGHSFGKPITARPYFSILIDHSTYTVLAWTITISSPSRKNVALLIRRCVESWGRLPLLIYTDKGAEFLSNYMRDITGHFGQSHLLRPAANSRFGGEVEGFFKRMRDSWCEIHPGKIQKLSDLRSIDRSKLPAERAELTIESLIELMDAYIEATNRKIVGQGRVSPETRLRQKLEKYPFLGIPVARNDRFLVHTAISGKRPVKVVRGGVLVKELRYNSSVLSAYEGHKVSIRHDPDDPFLLYVLVDNHWYKLESRQGALYKNAPANANTALRCWISEGKAIRDSVKDAAENHIRRQQKEIYEGGEAALKDLQQRQHNLMDGQEFDPFEDD